MAVKNALVVDDSRSARLMLTKMLQKNGLEVESVESGEEALEYLESRIPDVIFMDHMMPGIDGFETTRRISLNPRTSAIPVVMNTSKEGDDYIKEAKSIGACAILPKPATWPMIADILTDIEKNMTTAPIAASTAAPTIPAAAVDEARLKDLASQAATSALDKVLTSALSAQLHDVTLPQLEQWSEKLRGEFRQSLALQAENIHIPPAVDRDDITRQIQKSITDAEVRMRHEWQQRMDSLESEWKQLTANTTQRIEQSASAVTSVQSTLRALEKSIGSLQGNAGTNLTASALQTGLDTLESRLANRIASIEQTPQPENNTSELAGDIRKAQVYAMIAGVLGIATGLAAWFFG